LLSDLFKLMPQREYLLWSGTLKRAITASDAAYEMESGKGSAGFLSVINPGMPEETRLGKIIDYLRAFTAYGQPGPRT
jgi:hypothetical protein